MIPKEEMKISPINYSGPQGYKGPVQDTDCHHREMECGGDGHYGSFSITHPVSYLKESGQHMEIIKVGKLPR